jgi:hypothetical protein
MMTVYSLKLRQTFSVYRVFCAGHFYYKKSQLELKIVENELRYYMWLLLENNTIYVITTRQNLMISYLNRLLIYL